MIGGSAIALVGDPKFTSKEPWNLRNSIDFPDKITIQNNFLFLHFQIKLLNKNISKHYCKDKDIKKKKYKIIFKNESLIK